VKNAANLWLLGKHRLICTERFWLNLWLPSRINLCLPVYRQGHAEFPEREPYLYTSQFNIQGRLDPLTDNSHLSTASSLSPSREAVDETKIIKGVSR